MLVFVGLVDQEFDLKQIHVMLLPEQILQSKAFSSEVNHCVHKLSTLGEFYHIKHHRSVVFALDFAHSTETATILLVSCRRTRQHDL